MKCRIFRTKSREVAEMIRTNLNTELSNIGKQNLGYEVCVHMCPLINDTSVPAIYHDKGYWMCGIFYHTDELNEYDLTIA